MKIPVGLGSQRDLLGHFRGTRSLVRRGREAKPSLCSWNWLLKLWRLFGTRERGECETGCPYLCGKVIPQLITPADLLVINPKNVPSSALEREKQREKSLDLVVQKFPGFGAALQRAGKRCCVLQGKLRRCLGICIPGWDEGRPSMQIILVLELRSNPELWGFSSHFWVPNKLLNAELGILG